MSTLWSTARKLRGRPRENESESYDARWIYDFAKKVCPDTTAPALSFCSTTSYVANETPFSMLEFSLALLSCNNNAPGLDKIKFNLLKNLPDSAKKRLLNLFNKFIEQNIVPHDWRQVRVVAIQKPGKPASDHNSYRPISMLSCIRKLMERMILRRLDHWVEENNFLSSTQYGFRRSKGTNDCLALLSSEIQLAFEQKNEMASVFLDIKGAFDSVSIGVLIAKLQRCGLSPFLSNFLLNLLSEKYMNFSYDSLEVTRNSYMGLPQGSCLSPLLYNFYVRDIDDCLIPPCTLRQLADDGVVSVIGPTATDLQQPLQDTLDNLSMWALDLGIEFSTEKTEFVIFSRKHNPTQIKLQLFNMTVTQALSFKYLGVWFDSKCRWRRHIEYLKKKCQPRINFLRTVTGSRWGAHPRDLLRLYQTTVLSVLEYGSFCFLSAANSQLLKLERVQYRCLRIALGCMLSTHTGSLEVLAGVLPLRDRFRELALRFLIRCETLNTVVIENFERLLQINPQTTFLTLYHRYITLDIHPSSSSSHSVTSPNFYNSAILFDLTMRDEIHGIPDHLRANIIPRIFSSKYQQVTPEKMFFTDGSCLRGSVGFGLFSSHCSAYFKLQNPSSVYVAEVAAIYLALCVIADLPSDHYFIFTDSLSAIEAIRSIRFEKESSYFLTKIREILSSVVENAFQITFAWVPAHCSVPGNEQADTLAKLGAKQGAIYERPITYKEFFPVAHQQILSAWQQQWDEGVMGRWLHSIVPKVSTRAWFKGLDVTRDFIRVMSRLMSNHYALDAHLFRVGLAQDNKCVCGKGYHDIDHVVWSCAGLCGSRSLLESTLRSRGKQPNVPIRDILAGRDLEYMLLVYNFLKDNDIQI